MSVPAEVLSTEGAVGDVPFGTRSLKLQDYYAVLGVPRSATQDDISNAYRLTAIKWHPQRHPEGHLRVHATSQFQLVAEAFVVLRDPQRRIVYDRYGHQGLLYGVPGTALGDAPTKVNAMEVYETFFGSVSPFADLLRERQEAAKRVAESQGPAAKHVLDISLQEAVRGTVKTITLEGGRQFRVAVPPGTVNGTVLRYDCMGLEEADAARPGPLLVTGSGDLHYTKEVGLWESFLGMNLEIIDLASGRDVIDEIIMVYTLDTPLELMALALVNRATLQRTRELLHRMAVPDVDVVLASPAAHEPFMLRFSRHMAALAQLPTMHLMRSADIQAPSSQEVLPEAKGRQVDGHRDGVGLRNGLPSTMTFYCVVCKSPVLVNSAIMSDNYHGGRGPAFLVDWVLRRVVVEETLAYTTTFTTGSFKADKFLIEQAALYVPQCCRRGASQRKVYSLRQSTGSSSDEMCSRCLAELRNATAEAILLITEDFKFGRVAQLYEVMREQASAWKGVSSLAYRPVSVVRSHSEEAGFLKRALRFVIGGGRSGKGPSSVVPSVSKIDGDRLARYTEKVSCCLARMLVWLVLADPSSHESRNLITMVLDDGILEALSKVASSSEPPSAPGQTPRYDKLIILEGLVRGLSLSPACKGFTLSIHRAESLAYEIRRKWIDPHGLSGAPSDPTQLRRMSLFGNTVRGRLEEESTILMAFQRLRRSSTLAHLRTARGGDRAIERRLSLLVTAVATVTENDATERNEKSRLRIRNDLGAILGLPPERLQSRSSSVDMCPPGNPGKSLGAAPDVRHCLVRSGRSPPRESLVASARSSVAAVFIS
ncbi:j-protein (type III) [Perkinsus olseni]|uniref:J-protein (Type III) n=1 Tax=Perkinsus olseni TaxID=32597 RepID=A0A7J6P3H5_PEROL|nr:j-protein (type III) [Perkinsus olseni]